MIKFAVIGCGHIGKRHAEMIERNSQGELVALCDVRPSDELGIEKFGVPFFTSTDALFSSGLSFDVVNICTPNGLHTQQAIKSIEHGKHVVCEKPMGLSSANCKAVMAKAEEFKKQVFCVMQNRYSPPAKWLKELVEHQLLGKIYLVQVNCYWNRDDRYYKNSEWRGTKELDGGTLFTQFSHFVDIIYWLFGDIKDIQATFKDFNHKHSTDFEDTGIVNFSFVNGGIGNLNYTTSTWDENLESSITIIGETGSVKVGGQYMNKVEYCHIKNYKMPELPASSPANDYGTYKGSAANHHFVIENVINTLQNKSKATTSAYQGLKVVEIIERIYSHKKKPVISAPDYV